MIDLPAAVRRSCDAALLAESAINAGRMAEVGLLVGRLYDMTVRPPEVTARPGESPTVALARCYAQAGVDAGSGFISELVVTLAVAIVGWAQATERTTEEVVTELLETVGGV